MRLFLSVSRLSLSTSVIALGAAWSMPAVAQSSNPVSPTEAEQCAKLSTPQEQALCAQGAAQPEGTAAQTGDIATLPPQQVEKNKAQSNAIVITGSRIRTNPYTSPDPITVINPDLERKGGASSTAELLQESPVAAGSVQITDVVSAGTFVTNGGPGAETLSLRGLGADRTLVLVNGRRAGPAGTRGSIDGFDLNVLPSTVIQSVDILKTGASSIYGSDAVAGVVNLRTKTATDGFVVRGFSSIPFKSGGGTWDVSGAWGKEFSRGHVLVAVDYTHRDRLKRGDRDYLDCGHENLFDSEGFRHDIVDPRTAKPICIGPIQNMLLLTKVSARGLPTTADGNPYSVVQFNNPGDNLDQFLPPINDPRVGFSAPGFFGLPTGCATINPVTGARRAPTPSDLALCNTAVGLENQYSEVNSNSDVSPKSNRYTVWADASYELTDHIEAFTELLYNRRKTDFVSSRQLFFFQFPHSNAAGSALVNLFCDPGVNNCTPGETGDPFNQITGVVLFRPIIEIPTGIATDVKYTRGVGGLRGDFGSNFLAGNWHYDAYFQYSHSDGDYANQIVFQDAIDSQELRTHSCVGTVTRIRGVPCIDINWTDPRVLAGNFTPEEKAFLFGIDTGNTVYDQLTGEASVSGNVVNLPAGPVGLALGVQWRRDSIDDTPGPVTAAGNVWAQSVSDPTRGHAITKEAYGEIQVPLIHNTPFIQDLNFSGAARLTDVSATRTSDGLSDSSNGNWTYKLGLNWQTNEWLRFRATLGTSYRAPALFEQFLGNTTGFQPQLAIDPCINYGAAVTAGTLSQKIADRCASLGIPDDYGGGGSDATSFSGGGIGVLKPETSKAKTFSVVVTPLEGFWSGNRWSLVVDYFAIKVKGEIARLGANNIVFSCFNSNDFPNDPTCSLFDRNPAGSADEFNITQVRDKFININQEVNRGVDLTAQMTQDFGRWGKLAALAQMTWSIEDRTQLFTGQDQSFEGTSGEPKWVGNFRFTWDKGPWQLFWGLNVTGGTSDEQNLRDAQGDTCFHSALRDAEVCPIFRLKPQFYHNVSITRSIGDRFEITAGISNLFNRKPPLVSNAFTTSFITTIGNAPLFGTQYDLVGRRAFVSAQAKF